jgi:hypothetical protein
MTPLRLRKLADTSEGARVKGFDPFTGEPRLINPETGKAEPWPFAGLQIVDGSPKETRVSMRLVEQGVAEGWLTLHDPQVVHRPGGPSDRPWALTHTFVHASAVTFHTVDGDFRYAVVHQPDKYANDGDDKPVTDAVYAAGKTRVDWFYGLKLEEG